jgi:hypothetical protein
MKSFIIRTIKSRRVKWAGRVTDMKESINNILFGNLKGRYHRLEGNAGMDLTDIAS